MNYLLFRRKNKSNKVYFNNEKVVHETSSLFLNHILKFPSRRFEKR